MSVIFYVALFYPLKCLKMMTQMKGVTSSSPQAILGLDFLDGPVCSRLQLDTYEPPAVSLLGGIYWTVTTFRCPVKTHPLLCRLAITMQLSCSIYIHVGAIVAL